MKRRTSSLPSRKRRSRGPFNQKKQRRKNARRTGFEKLEARTLLAADLELAPLPSPVDNTVDVAPAPSSSFAAEGEHQSTSSLTEFAEALSDAGVVFWGSDLCPVCVRQKSLFREGADELNFFEVWSEFGVFNQLGIDNGITATPTWQFPDGTPDGKRVTGLLSLSELSEESGVPLPTNLLVMETNRGPLEILLYPDVAPVTVANFLSYVNDGSLDTNFFHRYSRSIFSDFVLQGGGFNTSQTSVVNAAQFSEVTEKLPIVNEFHVSNTRGTISMAQRGTNANSATSGFFINLVDNDGSTGLTSNLDTLNGGFAVFGEVLDMTFVMQVTSEFPPQNLAAQPFNINLPGQFDIDEVAVNATGEMFVIESFDGSGMIEGSVFNDLNLNGNQDAGDLGIENVLIFLDENEDGFFTAGELSDLTDANGDYSIVAPKGDHIVRRQASVHTVFVDPANGRRDVVNLGIGQTVTADFANFIVEPLTTFDLLDISDTGIDDMDDVTRLDNTAGNPLRFDVRDVTNGGQVRVFANNALVGQATGSGQVIVATNEAQQLQGQVTFEVEQVVAGIAGPRRELTVFIDSAIADSSVPAQPVPIPAGQTLNLNINNAEEADADFRYELQANGSPLPTGLSINDRTGAISWTPTANQTGEHVVDVVSTDGAGNTVTQALTIQVERNEQMTVRLVVTDLAGAPIGDVDVGEQFLVQAFVQDNRLTPQGIARAFFDLAYENLLVTPDLIVDFDANFPDDRNSDMSQLGLIDEIGAGGNSVVANGLETLIFSITFRANIEGVENFSANPADDLPGNNSLLIGQATAVESSRILFEGDSVIISPSPGANGDIFGVDEDAENFELLVLNNDLPFVGSSAELFISNVVGGSHGGVLRRAADNKSLFYDAPDNFAGIETFTYTLSDGVSTDEGFVLISVTATNDPPNANDDETSTDEDMSKTILVLDNDNSLPDPNVEQLEIVDLGDPDMGGVVTITNGGTTIFYEPDPHFHGTEKFTYEVSDGDLTSVATVTVTVNSVNDQPNARNDEFDILEDEDPTVFNPLGNDLTDPDDDETLRIVAVGTPSLGGSVEIINNGTEIRYTPPAHVGGQTETITYTISDRVTGGLTDDARMDFRIEEVNDPPIANPNTLTVTKGAGPESVNLVDDDSVGPDVGKGDVLTIQSVGPGDKQGVLTINDDLKSVTYTPDPDATGEETFTYTLSDGRGGTAESTLKVTIREFAPGSISGQVYFDHNSNGRQDDHESSIVGVQVNLSGTDQFGDVQRTEFTDIHGRYLFANLAPGSYTIDQVQPAMVVDNDEYVASANSTITGNDKIEVQLDEAEQNAGNDFTELSRNVLGGLLRLSDLYKRQLLPTVTVITEKASGNSTFTLRGFGNVSMADVQVSDNPSQVEVSLVNGDDTELHAAIPVPSPYVRQVDTPDVTYTRISGSIESLGFTASTNNGGAMGEGEANVAIAEGEGVWTAPAEGEAGLATFEPLVVAPPVLNLAPATGTSSRPMKLPVLDVAPLPDVLAEHQDPALAPAPIKLQDPTLHGPAVDVVFANGQHAEEPAVGAQPSEDDEAAFVEAVDAILGDLESLLA